MFIHWSKMHTSAVRRFLRPYAVSYVVCSGHAAPIDHTLPLEHAVVHDTISGCVAFFSWYATFLH